MRTLFLQVAPVVWLLVAGFGPRPTVGQQRDVLPVPNHGHPIWLVFSPDGKLLAAKTDTTEESQSITIWDVSARQVLKTISFSKLSGCNCLAFSPDGKVLATGHSNNGVRLWDLATGMAREPFPASEGNVTRLAFSPDGAVLAAAGVAGDHRLKHSAKSALHGNVTLWTVQTGRRLAILDTGSNVRSLRFLPDGRTVAIAREIGRGSGARQLLTAEVQIWDLDTFQQQQRLGNFPSWDPSAIRVFLRNVRCSGVSGFGVSLSPDGRRLATSELEKVAISDVATGAAILLGTHPIAVHSMVFSPDSQTLATLAEGYGFGDDASRTVRLWDLASRKQIAVLKHPGQEKTWVGEVAFSPDGQLIATSTFPSVGLYLWQLSGDASETTKSETSNYRRSPN